jgi:hypothetical protein
MRLEDIEKTDALERGPLFELYWSRMPGKFVNKHTGEAVFRNANSAGPEFTGTVREWYETCIETIYDGMRLLNNGPGAKCIVVSQDVMTIMQASVMWQPNVARAGQDRNFGSLRGVPVFVDWEDDGIYRNKARIVGKDMLSIVDVNVLDMNIV